MNNRPVRSVCGGFWNSHTSPPSDQSSDVFSATRTLRSASFENNTFLFLESHQGQHTIDVEPMTTPFNGHHVELRLVSTVATMPWMTMKRKRVLFNNPWTNSSISRLISRNVYRVQSGAAIAKWVFFVFFLMVTTSKRGRNLVPLFNFV